MCIFVYLVANILPGALTRLIVPICFLTKPGGQLCLSGMRPNDLKSVRSKFLPFVDITTEKTDIESHDQFGKYTIYCIAEMTHFDILYFRYLFYDKLYLCIMIILLLYMCF